MATPNNHLKWRLGGVFFVCVLIVGVIVTRLFLLQIVHHKAFRDKALHQYSIDQGGSADRGTIYMQSHDGTLFGAAVTTTGYVLAVTPKLITNPDATYKTLSQYVSIDRDDYNSRISKIDDPYEVVLHRVPEDAGKKIIALKIPGIVLSVERWRTYPGDTLASRTLGFLGFRGNTRIGVYGLEKQYESVLARSGGDTYTNFFAEVFGKIKNHDTTFEDADIVTTLEPEVERTLEHTLAEIQDKYHSDLTGGIVMDPKTGAIYAMNALPDFNVNTYNQVTDPSRFANPLVDGVYEIGSVMKTLTMAAGLDQGVVTPETTYDDKGVLVIDGQRVGNFDKASRGHHVSMQIVLNQSLNTGAVFVMNKLGHDTFRSYFEKFGIREKTGIDMPGEVQNITNNLDSTRDVEYATASFGQGIAVSPVSAIRAFATLGNGGILVPPHIVDAYRMSDGSLKKIDHGTPTQVITQATSDSITRMLVHVVDTSLLGGTQKMARYSIASKTGTAQMARADGRGYEADKYLHSIFAYFPAYNPKYIVFLYTVNPKGVSYASNTLGHPLFDLIHFLISYGDVSPDR